MLCQREACQELGAVGQELLISCCLFAGCFVCASGDHPSGKMWRRRGECVREESFGSVYACVRLAIAS